MSPRQKKLATRFRTTVHYALLTLIIGLWVTVVNGKQINVFKLHLVPLAQAIWEDKRGREPEIITIARNAGVSLHKPTHPLLAHSYKEGRLFYVFYNNLENALGPHHYLIQRIRKEERFYSSTAQNPKIKVTYLVEVFKLKNGALKGADQHYGSYGISNYYKREIIKEYEVGFGQINNIASGREWPFQSNILYKEIQDYNPDRTLFDRVKFLQSKKWKLSVAFNRTGWYSIQSPDFGFDAPHTPPRAQ